MTLYTVHIRDRGTKPDLAVVPDGFSWGAALFGFLWALFIGAWDVALVLFAVEMISNTVFPLLFENPAVLGVVQLGLAIAVGFGANELRRFLMGLRQMHEVGVTTGANQEEAERRYFDHHPDLTARMLRITA